MARVDRWDEWARTSAPRYPHEKVIQFTFRNFGRPVRGTPRALDLGCGAGVHTVFLASEGFRVTAVDISPTAADETRAELRRRGLDAEVMRQDAATLDLADRRFDLVICVGVLDAVAPEGAAPAVRSVLPLMVPGAHGLFLFAGEGDFRLSGPNPLRLHGYSQEEVVDLFNASFPRTWIDRYITTYEGGKFQQFDWLVTVQA